MNEPPPPTAETVEPIPCLRVASLAFVIAPPDWMRLEACGGQGPVPSGDILDGLMMMVTAL